MSTDAIAQSARDRIQAQARTRDIPSDQILVRYGHERLLYRIEKSRRSDAFVLKGATLFLGWTNALHRPTRDADFLAYGDPDIERLEEIFGEILPRPSPVERNRADVRPPRYAAPRYQTRGSHADIRRTRYKTWAVVEFRSKPSPRIRRSGA